MAQRQSLANQTSAKGSIVDTGAPIYCSVVINKTTLPVASPQEVMPVVSVKE
jgi:hypothetical protein